MRRKNVVLNRLLDETKDEIDHFLTEYSKQILGGDAALFLGSGVSRDSGFPSWSALLEPCANELGIDLSDNYDLYSIAQFYANKNSDSELRRRFSEEINKNMPESALLNKLLELSYNSIWTTNYDKLIETRLEKNFVGFNVISDDHDLCNVSKGEKVNIFKMNGDISNSTNMIITKNDYERYAQKHPLFLTFLKRELVSSTFLFVGYSFSDSLVLDCLNSLKDFLGNSGNCHYAIMLVDENVTAHTALFFHDLHVRYNIKCLALKKEDLTTLIDKLGKKIKEKKIFISGSYDIVSDKEVRFADELSYHLTQNLYNNGFRIATGIGKHLGTFIIGYAHQYLAEKRIFDSSNYLSMRPFPFHLNLSEEQKIQYRKIMQSDCSAAIFMFGQSEKDASNNKDGLEYHHSNGVYMEFQLARAAGMIIIPIGSTGYEAELIWNEVKNNINEFYYLSKKIEQLHGEKDPRKISALVLSILSDIPKKNRI